MKLFAVEYDFNLMTIHGEMKPPEHRVETFTDSHTFIERVKRIAEGTTPMYEALGKQMHTNIKTYGGHLDEIALDKVLDPFGTNK